jgi:hypothetical protein
MLSRSARPRRLNQQIVCAVVDCVHCGYVLNAALFNEPFSRRFQFFEQGGDLVFVQLVAKKSYFNSIHLMPLG